MIFLDTDTIIDVVLDRKPFANPAAKLLDLLERRPKTACIAWHSISNFCYLVSPKLGKRDSIDFLLELTQFISIAPTTTQDFLFAATLEMSDFDLV